MAKSRKKNNKKKEEQSLISSLVSLSLRSAIASIILYLLLTAAKGDAAVRMIVEDAFQDKLTIEQQEEMVDVVSEILGEDVSNYNLATLYGAYENENLNEDEKLMIYRLADLINENPYVDVNRAYRALRDLDIVYVPREDGYDDKVQAVYLEEDNLIEIFSMENDTERKTVIHELIHTLFYNGKTSGLPNYLEEGMTHLLTNEYFSNKPYVEDSSYPFEIAMVKMLCEMTSPDAVLKAYTTGNESDMRNILIERMGTIETYKFLHTTEKVFKDFDEGNLIDDEEFNYMTTFITTYFKNNFSDDEEKLEFFEYYMNLIKLMKKSNPYVENYLYIREVGVYEKGYFNSKLKNNNPNGEITFYNSDLDSGKITINGYDVSSKNLTYKKENELSTEA